LRTKKINNKPAIKRTYLTVNTVLTLAIILIFLYSLIFHGDNGNYPIPSFSRSLTGEDTISTGLSRSFSELVRFNFSAAAGYNPYGLRIWLFFVVELVMRLFVSMLLALRPIQRINLLIIIDATQAIILFIISFWPFLAYFFSSL